mmetsp:Transcript_71468/g.167414  ORF Transcript_71468/g.167414 Transcript_71468/m.167414 type:complete len:224 (-) Transcript_71468:290-961(-)
MNGVSPRTFGGTGHGSGSLSSLSTRCFGCQKLQAPASRYRMTTTCPARSVVELTARTSPMFAKMDSYCRRVTCRESSWPKLTKRVRQASFIMAVPFRSFSLRRSLRSAFSLSLSTTKSMSGGRARVKLGPTHLSQSLSKRSLRISADTMATSAFSRSAGSFRGISMTASAGSDASLRFALSNCKHRVPKAQKSWSTAIGSAPHTFASNGMCVRAWSKASVCKA